MKEELTEKRLRRKLDNIRTSRVRLLRSSITKKTLMGIKKLRKTVWRMSREWILDGYTRDLLARLIETLDSDLKFISAL